MPLTLVLASDTPAGPRGTIVTDPAKIDAIRTGEFAFAAVKVSDEAIQAPAPPPPPPDLGAIQSAVTLLAASGQTQALSLAQASAVNDQQTATIALQSERIAALSAAVQQLAALVGSGGGAQQPGGGGGGGGGGTGAAGDPADDVPLREDDGSALETDRGALLVGDVRLGVQPPPAAGGGAPAQTYAAADYFAADYAA